MPRSDYYFLEIMKASLYGEHLDWIEGRLSLMQLFYLARFHNVLPSVCESLSGDSQLEGDSIFQKMCAKSVQSVTSQLIFTDDFLRVYDFLKDREMEPVLLRGMIERCRYPWPFHMVFRQEDIYIEEEHFSSCHEALLAWGMKPDFQNRDMEGQSELIYRDPVGGLCIVLHKRLFPIELNSQDDLNNLFEGFLDRTTNITTYSPSDRIQSHPAALRCMGSTDYFLYLFCCIFKQFHNYSSCLRPLCDLLIYGESYFKQIEWNHIWKETVQLQRDDLLRALLAIGITYLLKEDSLLASRAKEWELEQVDIDLWLQRILGDETAIKACGIFDKDTSERLRDSERLSNLFDKYLKLKPKGQKKRGIMEKMAAGPFGVPGRLVWSLISEMEWHFFQWKWALQGYRKPDEEERNAVIQNVTFIYKSFNRQKMAKGLYRNIQSMYPGARVIIADDSKEPLKIKGKYLEVIHLPFNSGLSKGLNEALSKVKTTYVMRLDDDELLTRRTLLGEQLHFLMKFPQVDLVCFGFITTIKCSPVREVWEQYFIQSMEDSGKRTEVPLLTWLDPGHVILAKGPNIYLARTDRLQKVGFDDRIRMLDHSEFFFRAAGVLVTVGATDTIVFHRHNRMDAAYQIYRQDVDKDIEYIEEKHKKS